MKADGIDLEAKKNEWLKGGFLGGAIICTFMQMQQRELDIVFDKENSFVQEYVVLLEKRLETTNRQMILMANTEIERYCMEWNPGIYFHITDEIYEHYRKADAEYPLQAIGMHIDVVRAFLTMGERKKGWHYLHSLNEVQKKVFGSESHLFCRNWCHIICEIFAVYETETALNEYEENKEIFTRTLTCDPILYMLCMRLANIRLDKDNDLEHILHAANQCREWAKGCDVEMKVKVNQIIYGSLALYYRNTGNIDTAIETFCKEIRLVDNASSKLYILTQLGTLFYEKHDAERLKICLAHMRKEIESLDQNNELKMEAYNLCGLYYMLIKQKKKANEVYEWVIKKSSALFGEDADLTIKYKVNAIIVDFYKRKNQSELSKLVEIVLTNPNKYQQSYPMVVNNLVVRSLNGGVNNKHIKMMKQALDNHAVPYDQLTTALLKSNQYSVMILSENTFDSEKLDKLENELRDYFERNPNGTGYAGYMTGSCYRSVLQGKIEDAYQKLELFKKYLQSLDLEIVDTTTITFYVITLRLYLYKKEYEQARKLLFGTWKEKIVPLFRMLLSEGEEYSRQIALMLSSYIGIFISTARQYPQLIISEQILYDVLVNYKKILQSCDFVNGVVGEDEANLMLRTSQVRLSGDAMALEYFNYTRYDMISHSTLMGALHLEPEKDTYEICFAVVGGEIKRDVEILFDVNYGELGNARMAVYSNKISLYEKKVWERLRPFLYGKNKIYVCMDQMQNRVPLASTRIQENAYIADRYLIIYCCTGIDIKDDIYISEPSKSMFIGMSEFDMSQNYVVGNVEKALNPLPFVEWEIECLSKITGGRGYCQKKIAKEDLSNIQTDILHISSHTVKDNLTDERALVIGTDCNHKLNLLRLTDITEMDWSNIKLVVLSGCETGWDGSWDSLREAVRIAGAGGSISTVCEVENGENTFFMVCFYKKLKKYKSVGLAFYMTQREMRNITKREILNDEDYLEIGMDGYLEAFNDEQRPFDDVDAWGSYVYQMN